MHVRLTYSLFIFTVFHMSLTLFPVLTLYALTWVFSIELFNSWSLMSNLVNLLNLTESVEFLSSVIAFLSSWISIWFLKLIPNCSYVWYQILGLFLSLLSQILVPHILASLGALNSVFVSPVLWGLQKAPPPNRSQLLQEFCSMRI